MKRTTLKTIFKKNLEGQEAVIKGWVRSVRKTKKFSFVVVNDGTTTKGLQIIVDGTLSNYDEVSTMLTGTSVAIKGNLVSSQGREQSIEMHALSVEIIGPVDNSYPLQKKETSLEFLREQAHLRIRTNLFGSIFRVRHCLAMATHNFFSDQGFYYLNSPIITSQDGEGAGEMFKVTHFDLKNVPLTKEGEVDFSKDFFGKETSLTVTGQLSGECYALGLGAIYTFGPTFRSENSHTPRHLSEFWMIEPEVAFADLDDIVELSIDYIKYLITYALEHCPDELEFLNERYKKENSVEEGYLDVLKHVRDSEFKRITYTEAIEILQKSGKKFEYSPDWGNDLQTEHERYLTEDHFKLPVVVTDYPKVCKAFYMKANSDGKTVKAMDVLVPGVGEIIGGSQREDDLETLQKRMEELKMDESEYWWFMDLRKYGTAPHAGFGLGFERAIMYLTGMSNIRDVIPFPRVPKNAEF